MTEAEKNRLSDLLLDALWYNWMGMNDKARKTLVSVAASIKDK